MKKFIAGFVLGAATVFGYGGYWLVKTYSGRRNVWQFLGDMCYVAGKKNYADYPYESYASKKNYAEYSYGPFDDRPYYNDIDFKSKEDAENALDLLRDLLAKRGMVTVADYYKIAGQMAFSDYYNYGWTSLTFTYVYSYSYHGKKIWSIHFPEPLHITKYH